MTLTRPRPDPVDIPESVWASNQLSSFIARIAEEHGPIFEFRPRGGPHAGQPVVYMVGPQANRFVLLSGREHFSHDQGWTPVIGETLGHGLLNMDPPQHTLHRALMNPAFTSVFMAGYLPLMQRVIAERTAEWVQHDTIDLMVEAREITFDVAAAALVGLRSGPEVDWLRERFYVLLRGGDPGTYDENWDELVRRQLHARDDLQVKLLELIAARRSTAAVAQDDVLGMLVRAHDEAGNRLSDEQLLAHVNILLVAGHETTTTLGAWVLYVLGEQPECAARIRAELTSVVGDGPLTSDSLHRLPFLSAVIRETGRLHSPVLLLPRGVLSDFEFAGRWVEVGTPVFLAIAAGHRMPSVWDDPERFDPERFLPPREEDRRTPYGLATFGGGPRICLGINFAQLEVMALVAHVQRHYTVRHVSKEPVREFGGLLPMLPDGMRVRVTGG
ncbi:MAG: cytochrome P450 [Chloroflexi bacterium]|nr:cytochrome P450 [Chloroflexota bacterium]MBV9600816.1 cytochrome P450 [Chloroflexota bacterium]